MRTQRAIYDPAMSLAAEWKQTGMFRRLMVRWLAPGVARNAAALSRGEGPQYVNVPVMRTRQEGPATRLVDSMMSGSR